MDVKITWLGHSAFLIDFDHYKVLLDPFLTGNSNAAIPAKKAEADLILVSHGHSDHVGDAIEISNRCHAPILCNFELSNWFAKHGAVNTMPIYVSGTRAFPFGTVRATIAVHGSGTPDGTYGGLALGFILATHDQQKKIYFAGDTGVFSEMSLIGEDAVDVALLPIGDIFVMGLSESIRALKMIRPKNVIPMHYDPGLNLEGWKREVIETSGAKPIVLRSGESFNL